MTDNKIFIAPSVLAANFGALEHELKDVEACGADWLHLDVMDGTFVPPITFGGNMVELARRSSKLFRDVHLMIVNPEKHITEFKNAGADRIIVHQEVCPDLSKVVKEIRAQGMSPGVTVNPGTAIETVFDVLPLVDLVLVMTVNPGWGGQKFISSCLTKIEVLSREISRQKIKVIIEVDGGINEQTAKQCFEAGARAFVAGTYIFGAKDRREPINRLRALS